MSNIIIEKILAKTKRTDLPQFAPGDTIRVQVRIKEGDKERLQAFEGVSSRAAVGRRPASPYVRSASAREWSAFSPKAHAWSIKLTSSARPRSGAQSCTICAVSAAKLPV